MAKSKRKAKKKGWSPSKVRAYKAEKRKLINKFNKM